jgi:hypothetical protein
VQSAPSGRVRRAPHSAAGCGEPGTNLGHEVLLNEHDGTIETVVPWFTQSLGALGIQFHRPFHVPERQSWHLARLSLSATDHGLRIMT